MFAFELNAPSSASRPRLRMLGNLASPGPVSAQFALGQLGTCRQRHGRGWLPKRNAPGRCASRVACALGSCAVRAGSHARATHQPRTSHAAATRQLRTHDAAPSAETSNQSRRSATAQILCNRSLPFACCDDRRAQSSPPHIQRPSARHVQAVVASQWKTCENNELQQ